MLNISIIETHKRLIFLSAMLLFYKLPWTKNSACRWPSGVDSTVVLQFVSTLAQIFLGLFMEHEAVQQADAVMQAMGIYNTCT